MFAFILNSLFTLISVVPHPIYVNASELNSRNSASSDNVYCKIESTNEVIIFIDYKIFFNF